MEIEGYNYIISSVALAKELHEVGRFDIVKEQFSDTLCYDSYYENLFGVISSAFSGFYNNYYDDEDTEIFIFSDDCLSKYFEIAWEYGKSHNVPHEENPFVIEANNEARRHLSYCHSMGWRLLGYTKTKKTARQSKLIVYIATCTCDSHATLAHGLIRLYEFFSDKCAEFENRMTKNVEVNENMNRKGLMAA